MLKKRFMTFNSWIIKNQKGLSAVVTTLIVILLVLVAVGIMWVVVRSIVQEGAEEIELGKFTLDLEIKRAQIENGDVTVVVVKRNPGQGNLIGMNFVFSDGTNSEIIRENTTLQELEEKSFTFTLIEISTDNLETISVAPIFELSSGEESIGDIADSFEVTEEMKAGITGGVVVSNFEALGFEGVGIVNYSVSSGEALLPEFKRAIVDPLDILPGHNQTFTVHVYSPYSIVNVTSVTELDNSTSNLIFLKISEYEKSGETIEIWAVTWNVTDVHAITYRTTITAIDSEGNQNSVTLTWTDNCQFLINENGHGGDFTISEHCSVGLQMVNGLDGGNLTIQSGVTLTLNSMSVLVFNDGKSIIPDGQILVNIFGGSIEKAYIFVYDYDGDGYGSDVRTLIYSTNPTPPANYIRMQDVINSSVSDCCDSDTSVYPGQTGWFTTANACSDYDYNCDYVEEKYLTLVDGECTDCVGDCTQVPGSRGWYTASPAACGAIAGYISASGGCNLRLCITINCVQEQLSQTCR